jgi:hypothetical protein
LPSCRSRFQGQGRLEEGDNGSREERGDEGGQQVVGFKYDLGFSRIFVGRCFLEIDLAVLIRHQNQGASNHMTAFSSSSRPRQSQPSP